MAAEIIPQRVFLRMSLNSLPSCLKQSDRIRLASQMGFENTHG